MKNELGDEKIIRYLLGGSSTDDVELCDEDIQSVERQYLADPRFFEHMLSVEDDLIQAYASGELAPEDRTRFEQKYSQNPEVRERIRFFRNLSNWADKKK